MNPNAEAKLEPTAFIDDVEKRVNEIFSAQKCEVEQSLIEKINREKQEAQKRIEAVNQEFAQVRGFLEEHKIVMAELQTTEEHYRGEIRGHFERAVNYQKMMENAAGLAGDELEKIGGINEEIEKIRAKAEEEHANLKRQLKGYAGIVAQIPAPSIKADGDVDWNEEIGKLRRVRDLLATLRQADSSMYAGASPAAEPVTSETSASAVDAAEELAASLGLIGPEDDGVSDDADFAVSDFALGEIPAPATDVAEAAPSAPAELQDEPQAEVEPEPEPAACAVPAAAEASLLESLAGYRRTEPVNNGIELGFFASEAASVLDAETFMSAIGKVVENANQLHSQLTQTTSVKDLFLLKQEILNQQEILRKVFFRVVRFCDKESGRLPEQLSEIVGSQGMKDIIERLTMANWSDPSDFKPFLNELKAMKRAFEVRIAAAPSYLKSVLDEVEGREN